MKCLVLGVLALITLPLASANSNQEFYNVSQRLESTINNLGLIQADQVNRFVPAQIPWSISENREREFWTAFLKYYDYLAAHNTARRHQFIYNITKLNTLSNSNARMDGIHNLLKFEEQAHKKLSYTSYTVWKNHFSNLQAAFNELRSPKPTQVSAFVPPLPLTQPIQHLKGLKIDIDQLVNKPQAPLPQVAQSKFEARELPKKRYKPALSTSVLISAIQQTDFQIIFGLVAIFLTTLFVLGRPRKISFKGLNVPVTVPEFDLNLLEEKIESTPTVTAPAITYPQISLEEKCKLLLEDNKHLLDVANIKVHKYARSPFDSRVNASDEVLTEAISHLIKGTLAIANASSQKASFMEWNCKEQSGRVSLEFTLHGIDCDSQFLYMNALMDGDGSAPAYFGKTERSLDPFLATVAIKSANKKTTVSLNLDNRAPGSMNN